MKLLERDTFLRQFDQLLAEAAGGHGRLAFIAGEAGVGKTALVEEFARVAQPRADVLRGACDPLSTPRPLGPLVDIAGQVSGELNELLQRAEQRFRVFQTALTLLQERSKPALVIVEDAHWADEATLDLARFLGRRIADTQALLLVTYRDDEVGPAHPLRVVLGDLATSTAVRRIALPLLSAHAVAALAAGSEVDPVALHQQTGGNPFFVTEVLATGGHGIPPTVRDAVLARAARLSAPARAVLDAVAVIGPLADSRLLAAVAGPDHDAVDECVHIGVLQAQEDGYAFRHELARDTIMDALTSRKRADLHRAVLDILRIEPPAPDDLARLADHAEKAGDRQAVRAYAPAAARHAARLRAHSEAASQYRRALRVADDLELFERAVLLDEYAVESYLTDHLDDAVNARQQAIDLWRALGDQRREGESLAYLARYSVLAGHNAAAEQASQAAIVLLEQLEPGRELAWAYAIQAQLRMLDRDNATSVTIGRQAIHLATRLDEHATLVFALNTVGSAMLLDGDEQGRAYVERSLELARDHGLDDYVALAYVNLGSIAGELNQFPEAERYLSAGIAYCLERDLDRQRLYMVSWMALAHMYQGRWSVAAEAAALVLRRPGTSAISRIMALVALGRVRVRRGDPEAWVVLDEAHDAADQTRTLQRVGPVCAARAEAAWLAGDRQRAFSEARAAYDLALAHRHRWFTGELGYWRWRAGDPEFDADTLPPWAAEPFRLQMQGQPLAAAVHWRTLQCPFEAARGLAESDDGAALREALTTFEQLGARPMATLVTRRLRELGVRGIPRGPRPSTRANPAGLTQRELDVLRLLAEGMRNAEIAERLYLSPKTVERHVSSLLAKLDAQTRTEAVREAQRRGLFPQS